MRSRRVLVLAALLAASSVAFVTAAFGQCSVSLQIESTTASGAWLGAAGPRNCSFLHASLLTDPLLSQNQPTVGLVAVCRPSSGGNRIAEAFFLNVSAGSGSGLAGRLSSAGSTPSSGFDATKAIVVPAGGKLHVVAGDSLAPLQGVVLYEENAGSGSLLARQTIATPTGGGGRGWTDLGGLGLTFVERQPWETGRVYLQYDSVIEALAVSGSGPPILASIYREDTPGRSGQNFFAAGRDGGIGSVLNGDTEVEMLDPRNFTKFLLGSTTGRFPVQSVSAFGGSLNVTWTVVLASQIDTEAWTNCDQSLSPTASQLLRRQAGRRLVMMKIGLRGGAGPTVGYDEATNRLVACSPALDIFGELDLAGTADPNLNPVVGLTALDAAGTLFALLLLDGTLVEVSLGLTSCSTDDWEGCAVGPLTTSTATPPESGISTAAQPSTAWGTTGGGFLLTTGSVTVAPATTRAGESDLAESTIPTADVGLAIGLTVGACVILFLVFVALYFRQRTSRAANTDVGPPTPDLETAGKVPDTGHPSTAGSSFISGAASFLEEDLAARLENVEKGKVIAEGNFGSVYRGAWNDSVVAIKTLHRAMETQRALEEFANEVKILATLNHPNLVQYYGFTQEGRELMMVMEYMPGGSLLKLLQESKVKFENDELYRMARQVAAGMKFLAANLVVHRDLACRNCLTSSPSSDCIVKVADFGLARALRSDLDDFYDAGEAKGIPVRWSAPETLKFARSSTKSDVWSFGVFLFELFSGGHVPFPTLSNAEVAEGVKDGLLRLEKPSECDEHFWKDVAEPCFASEPEDRVDFSEILHRLRRFQRMSIDVRGTAGDDESVIYQG